MKAVLFGIVLAASVSGAAGAQAQVTSPVIPSPTIGGLQNPPYGSGFDRGVILGGREGCRNYNCPSGNYANRPYHQRYYDRYFDVPSPKYSGQRRLNGNPSMDSGSASRAQSCAERYRSYRASDNTYQPYEGPRRPCAGF